GPEADDLVGDLLEHPDPLGPGEGEALLVDDPAEDLLDLAPDLDLVREVELGIEILDDPVLDPELDVPERFSRRGLGHQPRRRSRRRGYASAARRRHDIATALRPGRDRQALLARSGCPARSGALDALQQ